jgi:hypothetical protein
MLLNYETGAINSEMKIARPLSSKERLDHGRQRSGTAMVSNATRPEQNLMQNRWI